MRAEITNPVLRVLVHGHVWLALCAAAQTWWTYQYLQMPEGSWRVVLAVFLGMMALYNVLRVVRSRDGDPRAVSPLLGWAHQQRRGLLITSSICAVLGIIVLGPLLDRTWKVVALAVLPGILYLVPTTTGSAGLRSVPGLKVFVIVWCWTMTTVVLPIASMDTDAFALQVLAHALVRAPIFFALAIAFDMRDVEVDPRGLRTIPQLLGKRWAKVLAIGLVLFAAAVIALRGMLDYNVYVDAEFPLAAVLASSGLLLGAVLLFRTAPQRSWVFYVLGLDGLLLLLPLLNWIGGLFV